MATTTDDTSILPTNAKRCISDLRAVRPRPADQRANPDIDVMAVWREDIEHTIRCQGLTDDQAAVFRAAVGV